MFRFLLIWYFNHLRSIVNAKVISFSCVQIRLHTKNQVPNIRFLKSILYCLYVCLSWDSQIVSKWSGAGTILFQESPRLHQLALNYVRYPLYVCCNWPSSCLIVMPCLTFLRFVKIYKISKEFTELFCFSKQPQLTYMMFAGWCCLPLLLDLLHCSCTTTTQSLSVGGVGGFLPIIRFTPNSWQFKNSDTLFYGGQNHLIWAHLFLLHYTRHLKTHM